MHRINDCSGGRLTHGWLSLDSYARGLSALVSTVATGLIVLAPLAAAVAQSVEGGTACRAQVESLPRLTSLVAQTGRLDASKVTCLALFARQGEFVRASLDVGAGVARTQVFQMRQNKPLLVNWNWAIKGASYPGLPITFEVPA